MRLSSDSSRSRKLRKGMIMALCRGKEDGKTVWSIIITDRHGQQFKFYRDDGKAYDQFQFPLFARELDAHMAEGWFFGIINLVACTHGFNLNWAVAFPPGCIYAAEFV